MRRPLKPFVTEYKGSARRNATVSIEPVSFESEKPGPKPFSGSKSFDIALKAEPEDAYDAAMRAADALFSIPNSPKRHAPDNDQAEDGDQPYFDDEPLARPGPEKSGGRILRVIDEAPSPELALLEAERAPKRRGRKPGSKNKPKIAAPQIVDDHEPAPADSIDTKSAVAPPAKATVVEPPTTAPSPTVRRAKRFPWMRDKLKPGEEWKRRRLPPVCW